MNNNHNNQELELEDYSLNTNMFATIRHETLTEVENSSVDILFQRALNAHKSGDIKKAKDLYEYILSLQSKHVETIHALGILAFELEQWETAIMWIQHALSIRPDSARFHLHLANVFKNNNQFEYAFTHYQTALYLQPNYAEAHNNLAGLFYKQNKLNEEFIIRRYIN